MRREFLVGGCGRSEETGEMLCSTFRDARLPGARDGWDRSTSHRHLRG